MALSYIGCRLYRGQKHKYNDVMKLTTRRSEAGAISGATIAIIGLSVALLAAGWFGVWSFINYNDQKTDVDARVALAVAEAKKEQSEADEAKFEKERNALTRQFVGPEDYGRLSFNYPKSWSVFVENDASKGGVYKAYLHRDVVPAISDSQQYMLRVVIEEKGYDAVISQYESRVKRGDLKSSTASFNGHTGTRLDGNFTKNIRGAAVIFKVRDKTVTLYTDADQYKPDFEAIVKSTDFNQ